MRGKTRRNIGERGAAWEADRKSAQRVGIGIVYPLHNTTHMSSITFLKMFVNRVLVFLVIQEKRDKGFHLKSRKINKKFTNDETEFTDVNDAQRFLTKNKRPSAIC